MSEEMREPYFSVGEEVICHAVGFPEHGQEWIISDLTYLHEHNTWAYRYENYPQWALNEDRWVSEYWIRKKHKPGDSFESIMNNINGKVEV